MTAGRNVNSKSKSWGTPAKIIEAVKELFGGVISLDPCSNEFSLVNAEIEYRLPEKDGLKEPWNFPTIYINPPFGKQEDGTSIANWIEKCASLPIEISRVMLLPVAVNTNAWKKFIFNKAQAICFLSDPRVKFLEDGVENKIGCPMACCLIYYGTNKQKFKEIFDKLGAVVDLEWKIT